MDVLIFSKDRAPQLDLLLRSMDESFQVRDRKVRVLFRFTSPEMERAYWSVFKDWEWAEPVKEVRVFQEHVGNIVREFEGSSCLFLCDDNVFIEPVESEEFERVMGKFRSDARFHSLSLRMSPDTDFCYPAKREMLVPRFADDPDGDLVWNWRTVVDQHTCWGYPMAVNTHVYRTSDIVPRILSGKFHSVNSLEAMLNRNRMFHRDHMLGFRSRKVFDVCNNYVRHDGDGDPELLFRYLRGERIVGIEGFPSNSAHGVVKFVWE